MKKLFENVDGNRFRLITESVEGKKANMVREGIKKVFGSAGPEISYKRLQGVGLGYIKEIEEARKCALEEARDLAKSFGYRDDETQQKFIKENDETNVADPKEAREVQIANEIMNHVWKVETQWSDKISKKHLEAILVLCEELVKMHNQQQ